MKKLKLNLQHLKNVEVLTREELKKVLGGFSGSGGVGNVCSTITQPCSYGLVCINGVCVTDTTCPAGECYVYLNGSTEPTHGSCGRLFSDPNSTCECQVGTYYTPVGTSACAASV